MIFLKINEFGQDATLKFFARNAAILEHSGAALHRERLMLCGVARHPVLSMKYGAARPRTADRFIPWYVAVI